MKQDGGYRLLPIPLIQSAPRRALGIWYQSEVGRLLSNSSHFHVFPTLTDNCCTPCTMENGVWAYSEPTILHACMLQMEQGVTTRFVARVDLQHLEARSANTHGHQFLCKSASNTNQAATQIQQRQSPYRLLSYSYWLDGFLANFFPSFLVCSYGSMR